MKNSDNHNLIKKAAVALLCAVLCFACGCALVGEGTPSNATAAKQLVITEVVSSNTESLVDPDVGSPDWFEIYNPTAQDVDISGFGVSDNMRNFHKYVFPEGTVVPANGYLIVYGGENNGVRATTVPCTGFGLAKSGDYLFLTDTYYNLLQQLQIPSLLTDVSYAMRSDGTFGYCGEPTPGKPNDDAKITDDITTLEKKAKDYSRLVISEVMPGYTDGGPWVELHNVSDETARLEDYCISDTDTNLLRYNFPDKTVAPHGYVIVYMDGSSDGSRGIETPFKLSKNDTAVYLSGDDGTLVSELHWEKGLPDGVSVVADRDKKYTAYPTKGAENSTDVFDAGASAGMDDSDPLRINEVLQSNKYSVIDSDGDRDEWVELYNRSDSAVSLKGFFLSDTANDLFKYGLPDVTIPAKGYFVVFLSGKDKLVGTECHANFKLGDDETNLYLTCLANLHTDSISLMTEKKANVSIGRDASGNVVYYARPTPGTENTSKSFEKAEDIGFFDNDGVYVSEVFAQHALGDDENDWIELHNGSADAVDISGWKLTDNYPDTVKWTFPEGTVLKAGAYYVLEATSHVARLTDSIAYMGLSSSGEKLYLLDEDDNVIDVFETGVIDNAITSGRLEDDGSGTRVFFRKATKGKANTEQPLSGYSPEPVFSETEMYQSGPISVSLTVSSDDAVIYYTTNGKKPTKKSELYTGPIEISSNTVLRAVSYTDGKLASPVASYTYIYDDPHAIPVVSVYIDPDDFTTVQGASKTNKPEREAYISYYEADGSLGTEFPCGMRAKGQGTIGYKQKSFSLALRAGYGQTEVTYPFFENCEYDTFSALVIRNSGQDIEEARMRDSLFSRLMKGMNLDYAETRPVAVYINGKYWGLYDLNEKLNSSYLETHTGVDSDLVDFVKRNETALKGSKKGYLEARSWGRSKDLADDSVFAQYAEMVDVAYCTDYIIAQTFIINSDMFNQKFWHTQDNTVKWRPVFYDLDWGLNEGSSVKRSLFAAYFSASGIASHDGSKTNLDVFVGLKKNAAWRQMFIERYVELLCTQLSSERCVAVFDELYSEMKTEMPRQIKRWGYHKSMSDWEEHAETLREKVKNRPAAALKNLQEYFKLSDSEINELVAKYSK